MESWLTEEGHVLSEDSVDQMLALAERLREANGGQLDDSAIQAVAEATGAPVEYVRLAVKLRTEKKSFVANLATQYRNFEVHTRRFVVTGFSAVMYALFSAGEIWAEPRNAYLSGILGIISLAWLTVGLYNACVSRDSRTGAVAGAILAGGSVASYMVFGLMFGLTRQHAFESIAVVPITLLGALCGLILQRITNRYRSKLGLKDPVRERQDLLRQLQDLQEKLKSGEQEVTFLSVDIVGSTKMKEAADALAVEYTFNEYHEFVNLISRKHNGRVHSTAGDGVTCAFDSPQHALGAARNISAGLLELNTFRNKVGIPITVRQGVHTGTVNTPQGGDIKSVNFAHVIDVASHLQKAAPAGSIVVSDDSARYMAGGAAAIGTEKVSAAGIGGTVWSPKAVAIKSQAASGPPPLPGTA